jgi:1,4-dihydroxy-2-naphthoate polyprenyltransferase
VDLPEKIDNSRVFTTGLMSITEGRRLALGFFGAAFVLGLVMVVIQGPALLAIGIIGILGGWGYSAGPRPLKFAGLGEASIIFLMGPFMTQGAYTAVTGDPFHAPAFWVGFAPGLLIAATVSGNNLSDIPGDRAAGVRTLAVRLGFDNARILYLALLTLAYATPVVVWLAGLFEWPILLPLLTVPIATGRIEQVRTAREEGGESLATLPLGTAQLHLLFSVLLVVGVVLSRI